MTTADQLTRSPGGGAADFVAAGNRLGSIGTARRHTRHVKVMRVLFPVASLCSLGVYALAMMDTAGIGSSLPAAALQKILPKDLKMLNPHYDGFTDDGSAYVVDAKSAQQNLAQPNIILLDAISATLTQPDKTKTLVTAASGKFNHKANILELSKSIDIASESGLKAKLTQATINTKDSVVVSKQPVVVEFPTGTIRSKAMTLKQKTKDVTFAGAVVALLKPPPPKPGEAAPAAAAPAAAGSLFAPSSEPIEITSDKLDIVDAKKLAVFQGNVKATQAGAVMTSPALEVTYENDAPADATGTKPAAAAAPLGAGKLQRIVAQGPVLMTQPDGQRVEAAAAEFDAVNETATLTGSVVMRGADDQRVQSDRANLDQKADTALLSGNVVVEQGVNVLKGRRFMIDRKGGRAQLTSPPGEGSGPGRISAHFVQSDPAKKDKSAAGKKAPEAASGGFATFKTDPDAPVDIDADLLDIDDRKHTATFRGDVKAVQGTFSIRTSELVAAYSGDGKLGDVSGGAAKADAAKAKKPTELTRIDARKNVVVTSKDGQMARGDWATFDAKANTVVVGGDVTLSDGGNLVRGTRLTIDMVSGESRIDTAPGSQENVSASEGGWMTSAPGANGAGNRGRPSAVLFPKSMRGGDADGKDGKDGKDDKAGKGGAADGWSAKSDPWGAKPQN